MGCLCALDIELCIFYDQIQLVCMFALRQWKKQTCIYVTYTDVWENFNVTELNEI